MSSQWSQGIVPPPPGVEPNFVDPPSELHKLIATHTVFLTLSTLAVAMRVYTRSRISRVKMGPDDYLCVVSYLAAVAFSGVLFKSVAWGVGRHIWDVPATWMVSALKYQTIASWIYLFAATCVKLSFLFLYRRLFTMELKAARLLNGGIAVCFLVNLGLFFGIVFFCIPVQKAWDDTITGHCSNPAVLAYFTGVWNTLVDIYVLLVPIPFLRGLNIGREKRLRLIAVFSVGIFACIASLVRLAMTSILQSNTDATYNLSQISLWATIEVHVGLSCSCLMLLPAFLGRHLPERAKSFLRSISETISKTRRNKSLKSDPQGWRWYQHKVGSDPLNLNSVNGGKYVVETNTISLESDRPPKDMESGLAIPTKSF